MLNKAILYYDPQTIQISTLTGASYNLPMYRKDLKIFRGVDNNISIEIKDSDRQPFVVYERQLKCYIVDSVSNELKLVKYLYNLNEEQGIYELRLSIGDTINWDSGFFYFSVVMINDDNSETLFYTTLDQEIVGTLELIDKPLPIFKKSYLIEEKDWTMNNYNQIMMPFSTDYITTRFPGDGQKDLNNSLQSFSVTMHDFTGTVWVQGSLAENPLVQADWFNIPVDPANPENDYLAYTSFSGIDSYNFTGNYIWVRFKYQVTSMNSGKIKKVWYKD